MQDGGATKTVGLTKLGAGAETLSGSSTYSGLTTITTGTLQAGAGNALSANSDVADNATLDIKGFSQSVGALTGSGTVTSSAAGTLTFTIGADNSGATFSGTIQKGSATSVAMAKSGSGAEVFNSTTNTYNGGTTIARRYPANRRWDHLRQRRLKRRQRLGPTAPFAFDAPANSPASANVFANNISGSGSVSVISANNGNLGAVKVTGNNTSFTGSFSISPAAAISSSSGQLARQQRPQASTSAAPGNSASAASPASPSTRRVATLSTLSCRCRRHPRRDSLLRPGRRARR